MPDTKKFQFEPLSETERARIAAHIAIAPGLIGTLTGTADVSTTPGLDIAFAAFLASDMADEEDVTAIAAMIEAFGAAFAAVLVRDLGFEWVVVSSDDGEDLALRALPDEGDVIVYPAELVAEQWALQETPFFVAAFDRIARTIREAAARKLN